MVHTCRTSRHGAHRRSVRGASPPTPLSPVGRPVAQPGGGGHPGCSAGRDRRGRRAETRSTRGQPRVPRGSHRGARSHAALARTGAPEACAAAGAHHPGGARLRARLLTVSVLLLGVGHGVSTAFGLLAPGTPVATSVRIWLHLVVNLVATVLAVVALVRLCGSVDHRAVHPVTHSEGAVQVSTIGTSVPVRRSEGSRWDGILRSSSTALRHRSSADRTRRSG